MSREDRLDVARQVANVAGVVLQIGVPLFTAAAGTVSDQNPTLVTPAGYAFAIWTPIFLLTAAYAVYQALPSNRKDPLLRRIGWFTALTFVSNGAWEILFPARAFVPAQVLFLVIFAGATVAYLRVQRDPSPRTRVRRWLLAPAFGLLFGWVTAAILAGFAVTLVATEVLDGGPGEAAVGAILLLLGGIIARAAIRAGRRGPVLGYATYAAAVLWALVAVVVNQYGASIFTTAAAIVAAVPVAIALLADRGMGRRREGERRARPRVV